MDLTGVLFVLLGGWFFLSPKSAFDFKAKWAKMMGVTMTGGKKAHAYFKYVGLFLLGVGVYILFF